MSKCSLSVYVAMSEATKVFVYACGLINGCVCTIVVCRV